MRKILLLLCLLTAGNLYGQTPKTQTKPKPQLITIEATTIDGRNVILKSDGTWEYAKGNSSILPTQKNSINIEAALVYKSGDVVPVSRTDFYLMEKDLKDVIFTEPLKTLYETDAKAKGMSTNYDDIGSYVSAFAKYSVIYPTYSPQAQAAFTNAIKYKTTSDFTGKAIFENIPTGNYFLVVIASTRKSVAVWSLPITVTSGENKLILDQNNAASVR